MRSKEEILKILQSWKPDAQAKYGIAILGIFGSYARGQQHEGSDIDGKWFSEQRGGMTGQIVHGIIAWRPIPECKVGV